ncbi:MAG TPA: sigma-70 family RNA polymerase sigma factor [Candidatus Angelobacter sp.]|nr:sigma-70 family RNA polymerase sigma factor [Candidatus Angelobacter sp.]
MDLVRYAQSGNLEAFEALVDRFGPELYRLAAAIVSEADASDLVQESFVTAWRELPKLRDPEAFPAWMRRICINRCRNHLRARGRRHASLDELPRDAERDPRPDFRDQVHDRSLLAGYFGRLNADQRAMVVLHYGRGLTINEAADALGIRTGTAKSRLNAGLTILRRALGATDTAPIPTASPDEAETAS